jgi:hypothetical protein
MYLIAAVSTDVAFELRVVIKSIDIMITISAAAIHPIDRVVGTALELIVP